MCIYYFISAERGSYERSKARAEGRRREVQVLILLRGATSVPNDPFPSNEERTKDLMGNVGSSLIITSLTIISIIFYLNGSSDLFLHR